MSRLRGFGVGVALALALAGCVSAPVPGTVTPVPTPTFRCTPEAGGAEFDCSRTEHEAMLAREALWQEAEAVYRKFFASDVDVIRRGGVDEVPSFLTDAASGEFVDDSMALYRSLKAENRTLEGGEVRLVSVTRLPDVSKEGSLVALAACIDARSATVFIDGVKDGPGAVIEDTLYFARVDGVLKIVGADGDGDSKCAGI